MTHQDIFDSLTRNAFDFLERGISEFDKSPKYSVIHFCAAVEMLLKARLMKEHWSLIVSKPDQANLARFMAGDFISVTRNEILYGLNQADKFILAIVLVDGEQHEGPFYVRNPFTQEPDWAVTSINLDLEQLLANGVSSGKSL